MQFSGSAKTCRSDATPKSKPSRCGPPAHRLFQCGVWPHIPFRVLYKLVSGRVAKKRMTDRHPPSHPSTPLPTYIPHSTRLLNPPTSPTASLQPRRASQLSGHFPGWRPGAHQDPRCFPGHGLDLPRIQGASTGTTQSFPRLRALA